MPPEIHQIIRSPRKTIAIMINKEGQLIIKAPLKVPLDYLKEIIEKRRDWIEKKQAFAHSKLRVEKAYSNKDILVLFGEDFTINAIPDYEYAIRCTGHDINISQELLPEAKIYFPLLIKKLAKLKYSQRTKHWADLMGLSFNVVKISSANGRWGSCSTERNINLNWKLALAPVEILDYVIVHELAHIKEMNHSPKFWKIVEKYLPNYKQSLKWLRDNGHLMDI